MSDVLSVYIGYDTRERDAWRVCHLSMARRSSMPLHTVKLDEAALRFIGLYDRPYRVDAKQRYDLRDGKPFSTDFSFTRFFVPVLSLYQGWSLYCDCDFLFTADIAGLFKLADPKYAVMVVKHAHVAKEASKMDGVAQTNYRRKNWSSLVLWNCAHPAHRALGTDFINHKSGQWLHAFEWLKDQEIGELPKGWNHLVGAQKTPLTCPAGLHFTLGTPDMKGHKDDPFASLWLLERDSKRALNGPTPTEYERALPA